MQTFLYTSISAKGSGSTVEQRSPKPLVACSNRVSPAKRIASGFPVAILFFIRFYYKFQLKNTWANCDIVVA